MEVSIISDTHGFIDNQIKRLLSGSDHIIHAGDVGKESVLDALEKIAPTTCVFGNIDGTPIRKRCAEWELLELEQHRTLIIHIAGAAGKYNAITRELIKKHQPDSLICGHSHILKVMKDPRLGLLHLNPGAAGRHGFHKVRTLLKLTVIGHQLTNLRVIELGPRSTQTIS